MSHPVTAEKNVRITAFVRNSSCEVHGLLTFECMWDRAGIIYLFESWACWSFEGGRECLSLVQSVSDHFKQCVGRDLNLRVA